MALAIDRTIDADTRAQLEANQARHRAAQQAAKADAGRPVRTTETCIDCGGVLWARYSLVTRTVHGGDVLHTVKFQCHGCRRHVAMMLTSDDIAAIVLGVA